MKYSEESKVLKKKVRRQFDINSKQDIDCYKKFLMQHRWGPDGCPFILEEPFDSIPGMLDNKLVRFFLKIKE